MAAQPTQPKRPYVRPRIGHSTLRSLWYTAALAGVLAVALLLPPEQAPPDDLDGAWTVTISGNPGGLPDGTATMLVQRARYALVYDASGPEGGSLMEFGDLQELGGRYLMKPRRSAGFRPVGTTGDGSGGGALSSPPSARSLTVHLVNGLLQLTEEAAGGTITGVPAPLAVPEPR